MALRQTRGLSAAQIPRTVRRRWAAQELPGGRSPLNAVALGDGGAIELAQVRHD